VIAESVEETVRIGANAWSGECHERTEGRGRTFERKLVEDQAIEIGVSAGIGSHQIAGAGYGDFGFRGAEVQFETQIDRSRRADVDILFVAVKSGRGGAGMVAIVGNIIEFKIALGIGGNGLAVMRDGILNLHRGAGDSAAGRVLDRSADSSRVGRLGITQDRANDGCSSDRKELPHYFSVAEDRRPA